MQMRAIVHEPREVVLSETQMKEATRRVLHELIDLDTADTLEIKSRPDKEGEYWLQGWYDGHGSGMTEWIRPATELDKAILLVLDNIK